MRELNSKQHVYGNLDYWWYNISSPSNLTPNDVIILNLWDTDKRNLIRKVILEMNKNWLSCIRNASFLYSGEVERCIIHIKRDHHTGNFTRYFGRIKDGVYSIN